MIKLLIIIISIINAQITTKAEYQCTINNNNQCICPRFTTSLKKSCSMKLICDCWNNDKSCTCK